MFTHTLESTSSSSHLSQLHHLHSFMSNALEKDCICNIKITYKIVIKTISVVCELTNACVTFANFFLVPSILTEHFCQRMNKLSNPIYVPNIRFQCFYLTLLKTPGRLSATTKIFQIYIQVCKPYIYCWKRSLLSLSANSFYIIVTSSWGYHFMMISDNLGHINRNKTFGKYALELQTLSSLCILMVSLD